MRFFLKVGWLAGLFWLLAVSVLWDWQYKPETLTFAVIGDYGVGNENEQKVADMVASWKPDLIITTGDNYYSVAGGTGSARYDESIGAYYCAYLKGITTTGSLCPSPGGALTTNRFFPSLGNHDYSDTGNWTGPPSIYTDYFNLPGVGYSSSSGNERYYDFVAGPVHFFVLNSNAGLEPDGTNATSIQAQWLRANLAESTSSWNVVYFHSPPFSSGTEGSNTWMQWPFEEWGADAVLSGDEHFYERIVRGQLVYFVNGVGGDYRYNFVTPPVSGSEFRYNVNWGAQRVTATPDKLRFEFFSVENGGKLVDSYSLTKWRDYLWLFNR